MCTFDGCTASICTTFTQTTVFGDNNNVVPGSKAEACSITSDVSKQCHVSCKFVQGDDTCTSTHDYKTTSHGTALGLTDLNRPPGQSCDNFQGYCDENGECEIVGDDSLFDGLDAGSAANWAKDNWPIIVAIIIGGIILIILLKCTYQKKKVEIKRSVKKFSRATM